MTAKEVKHRRGTSTQVAAMPPAEAEILYNITKKRLHIGDGAANGGMAVPNVSDILTQSLTIGTSGGTGNAFTLTIEASLADYSGRPRVVMLANRANTGAATLALNGLSALPIKKKAAGALVALDAGDIINGAAYDLQNNVTYFEVMNFLDDVPAVTAISQGNINTSTGTVTVSVSGYADYPSPVIGSIVLLPGGQYGFAPEIGYCSVGGTGVGSHGFQLWNTSTTYGQYMRAYANNIASGTKSVGGIFQQRYINASPPYVLGMREDSPLAHGFIYLLLNAAGDVVSSYIADTPPWMYNGPTRVTPDRICRLTGRKFRRVPVVDLSPLDILNGSAPEFVEELITQDMKNRDMDLIPHPFGDVPADHRVVLIDPTHDKIADLMAYQNAGGGTELAEALRKKQILAADDAMLFRDAPRGVHIGKLRFKNTKRRSPPPSAAPL